jgi:hypothetical protein
MISSKTHNRAMSAPINTSTDNPSNMNTLPPPMPSRSPRGIIRAGLNSSGYLLGGITILLGHFEPNAANIIPPPMVSANYTRIGSTQLGKPLDKLLTIRFGKVSPQLMGTVVGPCLSIVTDKTTRQLCFLEDLVSKHSAR